MRRRYDINVAKQVFEEAGCELLEDTYVDNKTPMRYRCHCGNESLVRLSDFVKGTRCGCRRKLEGVKRRHTLEYVADFFRQRGCELLETSYRGNHEPLRFRCSCGAEHSTTFSDFQNGIRGGCRAKTGLNRKWTEERVISELKTLIEADGTFPSSKRLNQTGRTDLSNAVCGLGGFDHFRRILKHQRNVKPSGYWKVWGNVDEELRSKFGDTLCRGVCPNSRMMREAGIPASIVTTFHGLPRIAERLGCSLASCWKTRDSHIVYSFYEFVLDEYLFSIGLPHEPNVQIVAGRKHTCDQRIGEFYVEIFGYGPTDTSSRSKAYQRKRKTKEALYRRNGLRLIPLEKEMFQKPYPELEATLNSLFSGLGFDITRQRDFDISRLAQDAGFVLTEEEVVTQLRPITAQLGGFPTIKTLYSLGKVNLVLQIQKTGGQNHYRRLLGYEPPVKPNNYWTLERTLEELSTEAKKFGRLPRQKEIDDGLANAIAKHGGMNALAKLLGLESGKRPNGWWEDEEKLLQTIRDEVISVLGHFPNNRELREMNRQDLANAVSRNGGFPFLRNRYEEAFRESPRDGNTVSVKISEGG